MTYRESEKLTHNAIYYPPRSHTTHNTQTQKRKSPAGTGAISRLLFELEAAVHISVRGTRADSFVLLCRSQSGTRRFQAWNFKHYTRSIRLILPKLSFTSWEVTCNILNVFHLYKFNNSSYLSIYFQDTNVPWVPISGISCEVQCSMDVNN